MLWPKYYADHDGFDHVRGGTLRRRLYETLPLDMAKGATAGLIFGAVVDVLITSVRRRLARKSNGD
jgi:hypothetical protein